MEQTNSNHVLPVKKQHFWQVGDLARSVLQANPTVAILLEPNRFVWVTMDGACCHIPPDEMEFDHNTLLRYQYAGEQEVLIDYELEFFTPYFH
ncbi:hypothetical protein [Larkinella punicea]|uniref:Uncharacterized protein n=1 Tax=Larkinella punicea TaxID=2315727 RepID=A0A368JKD3_9BACT|nr:hypothetical protein [Larkinella punicea]RCR67013.1 hypothetical protein DUE52_23435 [Larkinella punicea]